MLQNEKLLSDFILKLAVYRKRLSFFLQEKAEQRQKNINELMKSGSRWIDYDLGTMSKANRSFYISDLKRPFGS